MDLIKEKTFYSKGGEWLCTTKMNSVAGIDLDELSIKLLDELMAKYDIPDENYKFSSYYCNPEFVVRINIVKPIARYY